MSGICGESLRAHDWLQSWPISMFCTSSCENTQFGSRSSRDVFLSVALCFMGGNSRPAGTKSSASLGKTEYLGSPQQILVVSASSASGEAMTASTDFFHRSRLSVFWNRSEEHTSELQS